MGPRLTDALRRFTPTLPLGVACSGGADSTALLLACAERWPQQVVALHVHHGLQPAAQQFEQHCRALCARHGIPLRVAHIDARHRPGDSPEAAARQGRLLALQALARQEAPVLHDVALAQHADDQVETLLIALGRGAGLAGLSAMPAERREGPLVLHRPLLAVPGAELRAWLRSRNTDWVEDPTNADTRYTRNHLRAALIPALQAVYPQYRSTLARSAAHAAQAQGLLDQLAELDLQATGQPPNLAPLRQLGRDRQANLLRHWLKRQHQAVPSTAQLEELLDQVAACSTRGHRIRIRVGGGWIERSGQVLRWYNFGLCPD